MLNCAWGGTAAVFNISTPFPGLVTLEDRIPLIVLSRSGIIENEVFYSLKFPRGTNCCCSLCNTYSY